MLHSDQRYRDKKIPFNFLTQYLKHLPAKDRKMVGFIDKFLSFYGLQIFFPPKNPKPPKAKCEVNCIITNLMKAKFNKFEFGRRFIVH